MRPPSTLLPLIPACHADNVIQWQFPGWGEHRRVRFRKTGGDVETADHTSHASGTGAAAAGAGNKSAQPGKDADHTAPAASGHSLSQFAATALSGNDLTSSALYVISITFAQAGWLAPVCLLIVAAMLYGYRFVYSEVGGALPVNGGTYTALLHTTSKGVAATAATLSLLSYAATAVVSGTDAIAYLCSVIGADAEPWMVLLLLGTFCALTAWGIGESAIVAVVMFVAHFGTLVTLLGFAFVKAFQTDFVTFVDAFKEPLPSSGGVAGAIFFGFGAALLGVSGFESSANMIESIKPGEYPRVLRNMHVIVSVLNPLLAVATMSVLTPGGIRAGGDALLADVGKASGGPILATVVGVDAFVVLSGAVLTAFVGVSGLMERMAEDECLPQLLLHRNPCRGTRHNVPIVFFLVTGSLSLALGTNVDTLSGVYTISFLCVMQLFAVGALLLKRKRPSLPRPDRAGVMTVIVVLIMTLLGLLANLLGKPESVQYFFVYALGMGAVVMVTYQRAALLRVATPALLSCVKRACCCLRNKETGRVDCCENCLVRAFHDASDSPVVFFAKHADLVLLNKAVLYVRDNEQSTRVVFVHATDTAGGASGSGKAALRGDGPEDTAGTPTAAAASTSSAGSAAAAAAAAAAASATAGGRPTISAASPEGGDTDSVAALTHMVRVLDLMYPKIRLDLLVVDHMAFGPGLVRWLEGTLGMRSNSMFIACPDEDFPHTLGSLGGIRVVGRPSRALVAGKAGSRMPRVPFFVPPKGGVVRLTAVEASAISPAAGLPRFGSVNSLFSGTGQASHPMSPSHSSHLMGGAMVTDIGNFENGDE